MSVQMSGKALFFKTITVLETKSSSITSRSLAARPSSKPPIPDT